MPPGVFVSPELERVVPTDLEPWLLREGLGPGAWPADILQEASGAASPARAMSDREGFLLTILLRD